MEKLPTMRRFHENHVQKHQQVMCMIHGPEMCQRGPEKRTKNVSMRTKKEDRKEDPHWWTEIQKSIFNNIFCTHGIRKTNENA